MATTIQGTTVKYSVEQDTDDLVAETDFDLFSDAWDYCIHKSNNSEDRFVILEVVNDSVHKCWSIHRGELTGFA